jgi:acetylglutamate kinase
VKLVIQISGGGVEQDSALCRFAKAVSQLVSEGHRITVVLSGGNTVRKAKAAGSEYASGFERKYVNGCGYEAAIDGEKHNATLQLTGRASAPLVAMLSGVGVAAFGLCGADGRILRIRKLTGRAGQAWAAEVAAVDPLWLDTISNNKGVPVIENVGLGAGQKVCALDPDQMAGAFAIGWNADALVFITTAEGMTNPDGSVMRWLETEKLVELTERSANDEEMLSKLRACRHALKHGVRRARVIPVSRVDCLPMFYFSRIECGTEVIEGVAKTASAEVGKSIVESSTARNGAA